MTASNFSTTFGTAYTLFTNSSMSQYPRGFPGSFNNYVFSNSISDSNPNTLTFRYYSANNSEVPSSLVYRLSSDPVPPNSSFAFVVSGFTSYLQSSYSGGSIQATYRYTATGPSGGGTTTEIFTYNYSPRPVSNPFTKCPYKAYYTDDPDNPISVGFQYATKPLVISGFNSSPSSRAINIDFVLDTSDSLYTFRLPIPDPSAYPNAHLTGIRSYLYPVLYYTQNSSSWLPESLQRSLHQTTVSQVSLNNSIYLITSPGQNSIPDIPSNPGPGPDPDPDPSPGGNQDVVDSITDQTNQQNNFFEAVLSFFADFFGKLASMLIGVFIPLDENGSPDFGSVFDDLSGSLKSRLGFFAQVVDTLDTFFGGLFDHSPDGSFLMEFPGISFRYPTSVEGGGGGTKKATIVPAGTLSFSGDTFIWTPDSGEVVSFSNSYFTFVQQNLLAPIALLIVCFAIIRTLQRMYEIIIEDPFDTHLAER